MTLTNIPKTLSFLGYTICGSVMSADIIEPQMVYPKNENVLAC